MTDGGQVILAATPLGNPADASARLREVLQTADVIAAEDTRRLHRLATDLGVSITAPVVSYFEGNESTRTTGLVQQALAGATIAVVTDAGMPSVSDPGFRLVSEAIAAGVTVTAVPGPSAVLTALAVSGLPVDRFCFEGFLPRKEGPRAQRLAELADEPRTMVFFEAPHRLADSAAAMAAAFGPDRSAAICRELTKTYEQVIRGPLSELAQWATGEVLGEITVVVSGVVDEPVAADQSQSWVALAEELQRQGIDRKQAIAEVARRNGVPKRQVYAAMVLAKPQRLDESGR